MRADTVELIPGEHYLVLLDADRSELPERDVVDELASLALRQRPKPMLGPDLAAHAVAVADGIISALLLGASTTQYRAAKRWIDRYRGRRDGREIERDTASQAARAALAATTGDDATTLVVTGTDSGWVVECTARALHATIHLTPDGTLAEVSVRNAEG